MNTHLETLSLPGQPTLAPRTRRSRMAKFFATGVMLAFGLIQSAFASTAYGSLNNFDCVNDTGSECHGFEIELDDCRSTDITYTYDYNHYGTPRIYEDLTDPAHPRVFVRYESKKNANGSWASYTAIPSGPISPTQGHQFTDPSVNFGGEHFGVGFSRNPSTVKYNWLLDDGAGALTQGPPVYISTPTFTYVPAAAGKPAEVQAVVVPPPPPAPVFEFGPANWVKDIKTTTHNQGRVHLNQLVGDDKGRPQPWANGEPTEVETEWRILQTEFANAKGGKNGELAGKPEKLPHGNEMVTRRYEFYKYVGPIDAETGEAVADTVGPDGIHGTGTVTYVDHFDFATGEWVEVTIDLSKVVIVGDFFGAQMAGFDVDQQLNLIDHISDLDLDVEVAPRTVVVGNGAAFLASVVSGTLPTGMTLDSATGVLTGTPTEVGDFTFRIEAADINGNVAARSFLVKVLGEAPLTFNISTNPIPIAGGYATGGGTFNINSSQTVTATPRAGCAFLNWTENGVVVSTNPNYTFDVTADRNLTANFVKICAINTSTLPNVGGTTVGAGNYNGGSNVTVTATPNAGYTFVNWTIGTYVASKSPSYSFVAKKDLALVANFIVSNYTVSSSAFPAIGGRTAGDGSYAKGAKVTMKAAPNAGYKFVNWTVDGVVVSTAAKYYFLATGNRTLVANFAKL